MSDVFVDLNKLPTRKRLPNPKGRTDLGVGQNETGAYITQTRGESPCVVYRLRCITDGMCRDFVDDGNSREGGPMNGRQNVQNVISKEVQGFENGEPVSYPAFFLDKPLKDTRLRKVGRINVPVADETIRAKCKEMVERRRNRREGRDQANERAKLEQLAATLKAQDDARAHLKKGGGHA